MLYLNKEKILIIKIQKKINNQNPMSESTNTLPSTPMSIDQSFDLVLNSKSNDLFINALPFKQGEEELNIDGIPSIYNTQNISHTEEEIEKKFNENFFEKNLFDLESQAESKEEFEKVPAMDLTSQEKKKYFNVNYEKKDSLFPKSKNDIDPFNFEEDEEKFLGKKRHQERRCRRDNKDNIRKKGKRAFYNSNLIVKLNQKLKSFGIAKYFEKFPQFFVSDIDQKRNAEILDLTLSEIFQKKELYKSEKEKGWENYEHNLKVVESQEVKENKELKKILNKTFRELYEEYLNSDEFKIGEINRLKKHKMSDEYIKRYIYLSYNLIAFFSNKKCKM